MVLRRITVGLTLAAALLAAPLAAQSGVERKAASPRDLSFTLKGEKPQSALPSGLGEFNIRLDSQLPGSSAPATLNPAQSRSEIMWSCGGATALTPVFTNTQLELRGANIEVNRIERPVGEVHRSAVSVGSTLTLSSGYVVDRADWRGPVAQSVGAQGRVGRLTVAGEVAQERTTTLMLPFGTARTTSLDGSLPRAAVRIDQPRPGAPITDPERRPVAEARSLTLDKYSLEAAYNFSPRFEGRLSYRRSMTDVRDSSENVKVEGAVKAGQNMTIKAGYDNQSRPEPTKGQPINDHKVWTEFLLKF